MTVSEVFGIQCYAFHLYKGVCSSGQGIDLHPSTVAPSLFESIDISLYR